jgi:NADH dehydrogenase/NADH:ubiquinone oxidoreductase subunit G
MLGEDLSSSQPELTKKIMKLKFVALSNYFATGLVEDSVLLLPLASHLEEEGSYTLADGRVEDRMAIAPMVGAKSNLDILASLLNMDLEISKVTQEANEVVGKGAPLVKVDLNEKIAEAQEIAGKESVPQLDITHFGNNSLVKNFFWYRVNNKVG